MSGWQAWMFGLVPSIGVGLLFWYVMRAVVRSDRTERAEIARIEAADAARNPAPGQAPPARGEAGEGEAAHAPQEAALLEKTESGATDE